MPRVTLFRIVFVISSAFVSLFLAWFAIPSPDAISRPYRDAYVARKLTAGRALTTVLEADNQWLDADSSETWSLWRHSAAIIRWQLTFHTATQSILLSLGTDTSLNLTDLAASPDGSLSPAISVVFPTSDQDGICPPYFDYADATLLNQIISPAAYQRLGIRALTSATGEVQIWKHRQGWENFHSMADIDAFDAALELLATFSNVPTQESKGDLSKIAIRKVRGHLPTSTLVLRKAVLLILAPITMALMGLWMEVIAPTLELVGTTSLYLFDLSIIFGTIVVVCWTLTGRPEPFSRWTQRFWMTRWIHDRLGTERKAVIWGTTGPIDADEQPDRPLRYAVSLRGPADFFRSSSPLDDLLVTFRSTRWMIEPIGTPRRDYPRSSINVSKLGKLDHASV